MPSCRSFTDDEDPISGEDLAYPIAAFERTLNTPNSPFDRYLSGDENAISQQGKDGMVAFTDIAASLVIAALP